MAGAFKMSRFDGYNADPMKQLCIITPEKRDDAGPKDRIDPDHALCEQFERPFTEEELIFAFHNGIIQPIKVIKDGAELGIVVIGRRRTRIARAVNLRLKEFNKTYGMDREPLVVPVIAVRGLTDIDLRMLMVAENMQRADYSPAQTAQQIAALQKMGAPMDQICRALGKPTSWVKTHLALLDCSVPVQKAVADGKVSLNTAKQLSALPKAEQNAKLEEAAKPDAPKLTVRAAAKAVKEQASGAPIADVPTVPMLRKVLKGWEAGKSAYSDGERKIAMGVMRYVLTGDDGPGLQLPTGDRDTAA